jgi:hypothetical protein
VKGTLQKVEDLPIFYDTARKMFPIQEKSKRLRMELTMCAELYDLSISRGAVVFLLHGISCGLLIATKRSVSSTYQSLHETDPSISRPPTDTGLWDPSHCNNPEMAARDNKRKVSDISVQVLMTSRIASRFFVVGACP